MSFPKPTKRERVKAAREAHEQEVYRRAQIRNDAIFRSKGRCENPDCRASLRGGGSMDHWLGGGGRRRQMESVETVWMLCVKCDWERTNNDPDAETWNDRFARHALNHGYDFIRHNTRHTPLTPAPRSPSLRRR